MNKWEALIMVAAYTHCHAGCSCDGCPSGVNGCSEIAWTNSNIMEAIDIVKKEYFKEGGN